MKILAQAVPGNTIAGFSRAAEAAGHSWVWWEERHTPAFDVFDEIQPDMLFYMNMTRAMQKCVDTNGIPTLCGSLDSPFQFKLNQSYNVKCDYLVDAHMFNMGEVHKGLACDIGITCDTNPVGLKLCQEAPCQKVWNIKILNDTAWPTTQYLGVGTLSDKRDLYRSASLVVVDTLMDVIRVIACGSIPVSVNQEVSTTLLNHGMLIPYYDDAYTLMDFHNNVVTRNPSEGASLLANLRGHLAGHAYDDALTLILENAQ